MVKLPLLTGPAVRVGTPGAGEAAEPRRGLRGGRLPRGGAPPGVRLHNCDQCRCAAAIGKESYVGPYMIVLSGRSN